MEEEILSLKWNNHNSTFIQTLSTLHKAEKYSDVTLACEGKYYQVHKLVLSICSEYFEEILSRTKCQHPVIVLKDIKHSDLEALLNYMYAGEANVAQSELANLIKAAECLRIKGLAVPDETPPVRDKRRHNESTESSHSSKKRRNDEVQVPASSSNGQIFREMDSFSENSKSLESSIKTKRRSTGNESEHLPESHDERISSNTPGHIQETYKTIPEITLDAQPVEVKQEVTEPKIEEHEDNPPNLDDSNLDLDYTMNVGDEENSEGERHGQDTCILHDLMSVPGSSGVQGHESISNWENNSNHLSGYSVESYSSDEGRNQQMDPATTAHFDCRPYVSSKKPMDFSSRLEAQGYPLVSGRTWHCPYQFCEYVADRGSALTKHVRKHTGEKPFSCSQCSYASAQKSNLTSHIKLKHPTIAFRLDSKTMWNAKHTISRHTHFNDTMALQIKD